MNPSIEKIYATLIDKEYQRTLFGDLPLFQRKGNGFVACCPFHHDTLPTLLIYGDRPEYFCFACSSRGDWIRYVMKKEGISFHDAVKAFEHAAVFAPDEYQEDKWEGDFARTMLLEAAMDLFIMNLWSKPGEEALHYLYNRGYAMGEVKGMALGFYPGPAYTQQELMKQGFAPGLLESFFPVQGGVHPDAPGIVIPYRDASGRLVEMVHKDMRTQGASSYRFMTGCTSMDDIPFLLYRSRGQHEVLVVQGFFDALLIDQARLKPVIGTGAGGMNPAQIAAAAFFGTRHFIMAQGGDEHQSRKIHDAVNEIMKAGFMASVLPIPSKYKDLDEYMRMTCLDHFRALFKKAVPAQRG
jgi:DNA primase